MKKLSAIILLVTAMTGCAATSASSTLTKSEQKLQWVKNANPQQDAQIAIETGDLRMMGLVQRTILIPGVPLDQMDDYQQKCGVNLIEGVSDTVLNSNHLKLIHQAHQYALQYNAIIKNHCAP
jgi:hypothetical protein